MKMEPPRRVPDEEQKLIVLSCLQHLGPCRELQLLQFLAEHDFMNYFDMMFALNDLCDRGQAVRKKKDAGYEYALTEAGREALRLFGSRVPRSMQALLSQAEEWKQRFRRESQYRRKIEKTDREDYELTLTVTEQEMDMMRLSLILPTRELAQQLSDRWTERAARVYEAVIRILSEEEK